MIDLYVKKNVLLVFLLLCHCRDETFIPIAYDLRAHRDAQKGRAAKEEASKGSSERIRIV